MEYANKTDNLKSDNEKYNITLLFDYYTTDSMNLHNSFVTSGVDCNVLVINDDGFLPDGVISIYQSILDGVDTLSTYSPKYFNEIDIPDYWEIKSTNSSGQIYDMGTLKARLFYANPTYKRYVRAVEYLDNRGVVRFCDYYNKSGSLYARATFDASQKIILKSYFDAKKREVIVENYITNDIIINYYDKVIIYHSKVEFIKDYIVQRGYDKTNIYINSLSVPFFVSNSLPPVSNKGDILFWQEHPRDDIPGNMQFIFEKNAARIKRIYVQKSDSYDKLVSLGVPLDIVKRKGYVYPYVRSSKFKPEALILTNSDQIDHIADIVNACHDIHFHIAAITEMSNKLMMLGKYINVTLYPTVDMDMVDTLYQRCDIYLDINRESEILNAIYKAFLNNQIIFAYTETLHNINYVDKANCFCSSDYNKLIDVLKRICKDSDLWNDMLDSQRKWALSEDKSAFL